MDFNRDPLEVFLFEDETPQSGRWNLFQKYSEECKEIKQVNKIFLTYYSNSFSREILSFSKNCFNIIVKKSGSGKESISFKNLETIKTTVEALKLILIYSKDYSFIDNSVVRKLGNVNKLYMSNPSFAFKNIRYAEEFYSVFNPFILSFASLFERFFRISINDSKEEFNSLFDCFKKYYQKSESFCNTFFSKRLYFSSFSSVDLYKMEYKRITIQSLIPNYSKLNYGNSLKDQKIEEDIEFIQRELNKLSEINFGMRRIKCSPCLYTETKSSGLYFVSSKETIKIVLKTPIYIIDSKIKYICSHIKQ